MDQLERIPIRIAEIKTIAPVPVLRATPDPRQECRELRVPGIDRFRRRRVEADVGVVATAHLPLSRDGGDDQAQRRAAEPNHRPIPIADMVRSEPQHIAVKRDRPREIPGHQCRMPHAEQRRIQPALFFLQALSPSAKTMEYHSYSPLSSPSPAAVCAVLTPRQ